MGVRRVCEPPCCKPAAVASSGGRGVLALVGVFVVLVVLSQVVSVPAVLGSLGAAVLSVLVVLLGVGKLASAHALPAPPHRPSVASAVGDAELDAVTVTAEVVDDPRPERALPSRAALPSVADEVPTWARVEGSS